MRQELDSIQRNYKIIILILKVTVNLHTYNTE